MSIKLGKHNVLRLGATIDTFAMEISKMDIVTCTTISSFLLLCYNLLFSVLFVSSKIEENRNIKQNHIYFYVLKHIFMSLILTSLSFTILKCAWVFVFSYVHKR